MPEPAAAAVAEGVEGRQDGLADAADEEPAEQDRSEEHTSELQSR